MSPVSEESLLTFPCDLPIKILGRNVAGFREAALGIVRAHYRNLRPEDVSEQVSRQGTFVSLTVTLHAESRAQVDAVYRALTASEDILIVL